VNGIVGMVGIVGEMVCGLMEMEINRKDIRVLKEIVERSR
jgi:hypothetical protein